MEILKDPIRVNEFGLGFSASEKPLHKWNKTCLKRYVAPQGLVSLQKSMGRKRLPQNFAWKFLAKICDDVEALAEPVVKDVVRKLRIIIRARDLAGYLSFCDTYSLSQISEEVNKESANYSVRDIRMIRILTIFRKYDFPESLKELKEREALETFAKAEESCKMTNLDKIFSRVANEQFDWMNFPPIDALYYAPILSHARNFIVRTLGNLDVEVLFAECHHGPGASLGCPFPEVNEVRKWELPMTVSPTAQNLAWQWLASDERFLLYAGIEHLSHASINGAEWHTYLTPKSLFKLENAARIHLVPKNAKTFRTIAVEATANAALQLGVGSLLSKKLRRWGLDLRSQKRNQELAKKGSETNELATLDLSSASDTVSLAWLELLPADWKELFSCLRMQSAELPSGEIIPLSKVSSMGNGYTFGLESLVFSSILYGVVKFQNEKWEDHKDNIAVYGDDIICPQRFVYDLRRCLKRFGFKVNKQKSFWTGSIRESCGTDYFKGERIDIPSVTETIRDMIDIRILYNRLIQTEVLLDFNLTNSLNFLMGFVEERERNFGPICEDLVGWFFVTRIPQNARIMFHESWQKPVVRTYRTTLSHPWMKGADCDITALEAMPYLSKNFQRWYGSKEPVLQEIGMERASPWIRKDILRYRNAVTYIPTEVF